MRSRYRPPRRRRVALRMVAIAFGLAVALTGAGVAAATPAKEKQADDSVGVTGIWCDPGYHCVFYTDFDSARHSFFNSDSNFYNDRFDEDGIYGGLTGYGQTVDNNVYSVSNSSSGGYYSYYYYLSNYGGGLVFCVRPGSQIIWRALSAIGGPGDGQGQLDEASSLRLSRTGNSSCI